MLAQLGVHHLLFGFQYSPLKVSGDHFTTAVERKQAFQRLSQNKKVKLMSESKDAAAKS